MWEIIFFDSIPGALELFYGYAVTTVFNYVSQECDDVLEICIRFSYQIQTAFV